MTSPGRSNTRAFAHYTPDRIRAAVGFEEVTESVARALADRSRGLGDSPVAVFAPKGRDGDVHVKSAWLLGRAIFTVKVATWFAARAERGDSPSGGIVAVFDARTGDLRALLEDEHHLSDIRTAAAGALATRTLARSDAVTLSVLGTGVQAYLQVLAAAGGATRSGETGLHAPFWPGALTSV
jgi:ornithine cyclodeaminase/alanine dehydrogenase-like protein (mu-crystallin family)